MTAMPRRWHWLLSAILLAPLTAHCAVPRPAPVKTDVRVGAYVFPGWYRSPGEWDLIAKFAEPRALLGFYDDSLPEVNDWHIKWAVDAGISWFAFDWYWHSGEKHLHRSLEDGFLKAQYSEMMDFCIHWCNHPVRGWPPVDNSAAGVEAVVRYCAEHYFGRANYLKVHGRPVLMVWKIEAILKANAGPEGFRRNLLPRLNAICHAHGQGDLFLILANNSPKRIKDIPVGDAFTGYSYAGLTTRTPWSRPGSAPYSEMVELLPSYWREMHAAAKPFLTSTQAGWDNLPRTHGHGHPQHRWARTNNTIALFEQTLSEGKAQVKPDFPFFLIEAWNEWGEGSYIEPSKKFGFGHMEAIRRVFARQAPAVQWPRPTQAQIDSYGVLKGNQLRAARAREGRPDPPAPVKEWPMTVSLDPPGLDRAPVLDLSFRDEQTIRRFQLAGKLRLVGQVDGRTKLRIVGPDPWMLTHGDWGPIAPGMVVAIRLRYHGKDRGGTQFFWGEAGLPLSEERSTRYVLQEDGRSHTYALTFRRDRPWGGKLEGLRFDFPSDPDGLVELEWIRLFRPKG